MALNLQRAPSAADLEQLIDLFDHGVRRTDNEYLVDQEFQIRLERINTMVFGKAVHHAKALPDRNEVSIEAIADRSLHHFLLRLCIRIADENRLGNSMTRPIGRKAGLDVSLGINLPMLLKGVQPGINGNGLEIPFSSQFH